VNHPAQTAIRARLNSTAAWLSPRRLRAQALVLAVCLWGVCAVDFLTPGSFDRAANIKFQDFLTCYISARLIHQGRTAELYDDHARTEQMLAIIHSTEVVHESEVPPTAHPPNIRLPNLYGPQVALWFVPLTYFSFLIAAQIWVLLNLLLYWFCVYRIWKCCPALRFHGSIVALCALAFPPLFHFVVRGQISVLPLACFTAAFLGLRAQHEWLAGMALGLLILKPQFLVAIPLVLLLVGAWRLFTGLALSAAAQMACTHFYFGTVVMHSYVNMLWHPSRWIDAAELALAPIQMHSLRSFWTLLLPWPEIALALYVLSSIVVIAMAVAAWRSSSLAFRFSALTLAAVLVNPHLFVYDLLVLAPVLLLLADWIVSNPQHISTPALHVLTYLAFVLPLFGPLSRWTHVQLSVPAFIALLWVLLCQARAPGHKLASNESRVV
jgi:hypothetical protein